MSIESIVICMYVDVFMDASELVCVNAHAHAYVYMRRPEDNLGCH